MKKLNVLTRMLLLVALLVWNVGRVWGQNTYELVTNVSQLSDGDKVILVNSKEDGNHSAMGAANTSNNRKTVIVEIGSNIVSTSVDNENETISTMNTSTSSLTKPLEVTLVKSGENWNLSEIIAENQVIYLNGGSKKSSGNNNHLKAATSVETETGTGKANGVWSISIANTGIATIKNQNNYTIYVNGSLFASYSSKGNTYDDVYIFKKVANRPILTVSPATAKNFSYDKALTTGPSEAQKFTVTGSNLTDDDITVSLNAGSTYFEISSDGTTYGTSNLTVASGDDVYVRLKANLAVADDYAGTLRFANDGADNVDITLAGEVTRTPPTISADDVEIPFNTTNSSIAFTVEYPYGDGTVTAAEKVDADWLTLGAVGANSVSFTTSVNSGEERTATVTLTYTYNTNETKTKDVTITQAPALSESWVETDLADLTASDIFVIVGNNGSNYAMSNDNGTTSAPAAVAVTVSDGKITSQIADNIKWNISGNSTDGYVFYPNGSTTTWLYCTGDNNGVRVGNNANKTFEIKDSYLYHNGTSRYVGIYSSQNWRCYTSINANIKDQTFKFYKKVQVAKVEIKSAGKATFSSTSKLDFTGTGITAYIAKTTSETSVSLTEVSVVPANTGLLLSGEAGTYDIPVSSESADDVKGNLLQSTATAAHNITNEEVDKAFVFGSLNGNVGFYKAAKGKTIGVGKSYLLLSGTGAKDVEFLSLGFGEEENETTSISEELRVKSEESAAYNLAGQKVGKEYKGIVVVNGKKYLRK